jgi:hypothetical protein
MFLSEKAKEAVLTNRDLRMDIGKELSRSEDRVRRLAQANDRNNDLTKYRVVLIIQEGTKMAVEDILVNEKPELQSKLTN